MTPEDAAAILGVAAGASRKQVEQAYRRLARESHPDRMAGAALRDQALAQAKFVKATEARTVLFRGLALAEAEEAVPRLPPKHNWPLLAAWVAVFAVATTVSVVGSSLPLTVWEPTVRFGLMGVSAVTFALTGARIWLVLLCAAIAATAVTTIAFTTFGALLGMFLLAAPLYGFFAAGRGRTRFSGDTRATSR